MTVIFGRNRHIAIPALMQVQSLTPRGGAAAGNGLLNALIAYWPGDEASGNLIDAHTNGLDLTDTNTVTNAAGKVYATARQYTKLNNEYHIRSGDDALLSTGDVDFSVSIWVYFDSLPSDGVDIAILAKDNGSGENKREYRLDVLNNSGTITARWYTFVSAGGVCGTASIAAPATGEWHHFFAYHDAVSNAVGISMDNADPTTSATSGVPCDSTAYFSLGSRQNALFCYDGRIGPTAFWKSTAGSGGVLTADQRTALYNSGNGLAYASFTT